jgi:lipid-A-disaccharide synthase-like uncharacterized protein
MEFKFLMFGHEVVVTGWKVFGVLGALMFTFRWFVQMHASRKAGKPVTPRSFWIISMVGSVILLTYFICSPKQDLVGVLSNLFPTFIAGYNLYLDLTHEKKADAQAAAAKAQAERKPVSVRMPAIQPVAAND